MALNPPVMTYVGTGAAGVWSDPNNWSKGLVPNAADTARFSSSAVLNGPIEVFNLMLLGAETISVNGQVKTDNMNVCQSFMVCEGAVVTFNAGSSLADAGGLVCGIDASGTVIVDGASATHAAAALNVINMKIGQSDSGIGVLTVAGGIVNDSGMGFIGLAGRGTLNVSGAGQASYKNLVVGYETGSNGNINISGNGTVTVAGGTKIGTAVPNAPGGVGVVTISGSGVFTSDQGYSIGAGSAVHMAGGTLIAGPDSQGIVVNQLATLSGFGAANSSIKGVTDNGTLASAGGTLVVTGNINGMGAVQIGAGSTLDLIASNLNVPSLQFMGANATLDLASGVRTQASIGGFGVTDHIDMAGINAASWNALSGILTLTGNGIVLDRLTLTGVAAGDTFTVAQSGGVGVLSLHSPSASNGFIDVSHH